ncbi:hypothetical protein [Microbacterium maritypicum]|uniref:hypothetical protein n=1 Tax=Microbacterium maritypicum TaxID=33918 RepID=UPI0022DFFEEB|nr:hypothetical protein [Microbacterium liquefaciens]
MDTLLRGGRVIDPKTETDRITDLLITQGRVAAVGDGLTAPTDAEVVDVTGLIVGPGFVDLHSHVHSIAGCPSPTSPRRWICSAHPTGSGPPPPPNAGDG